MKIWWHVTDSLTQAQWTAFEAWHETHTLTQAHVMEALAGTSSVSLVFLLFLSTGIRREWCITGFIARALHPMEFCLQLAFVQLVPATWSWFRMNPISYWVWYFYLCISIICNCHSMLSFNLDVDVDNITSISFFYCYFCLHMQNVNIDKA
jgi:hypothetical protein